MSEIEKDCDTCKHKGSPRQPCLSCTVTYRDGAATPPSKWEARTSAETHKQADKKAKTRETA